MKKIHSGDGDEDHGNGEDDPQKTGSLVIPSAIRAKIARIQVVATQVCVNEKSCTISYLSLFQNDASFAAKIPIIIRGGSILL
jgi:hypothetical protein